MYFLGLDPSTKCTGFCLMNEKYDIIESGKIDLPDVTEGEKIYHQIQQVENLINKYPIDKILCEDQFSKLNIDTLKKLSRNTGGYLALAAKHNLSIELIYPTSWRKVFHGSGKAKKQDTFHKVVALYPELGDLKFTKDNDLTDACGIAWACVDLYKEGAIA